MQDSLALRLRQLRARIAAAAVAAGRDPQSIRLLAVSKTRPATDLADAVAGGQLAFGENYVQEALAKISALPALIGAALPAVEWHFIGPLQSNKTRAVAGHFDWCQSVDSRKLADRLSAQRPEGRAPLNVCVQVRIGDEDSKSGAAPAELAALAAHVASLPGLRLRGLMTIPPPSDDPAQQRRWFAEARALYEQLRAQHASVDTLSMGMSGDLEAAIHEGATLVRVGTALFGERARKTPEA